MAYPPIQELPPAPQRGDTDFSEKANAHVAALTPWTQDVNAAGAFIEQCVTAAAESRDGAAESADQAADSATAAEQSRSAAASFANFKGRWADLEGALLQPASVLEDGKIWTLLTDLADVTLSQPGVSDDWATELVLQGDAAGPINMAGYALNVDAVKYNTVNKGAVSAGTVSFDVEAATKQKLTVGGAITIELTNKPANDWELEIDLTNGGAFAITFPTVNWLIGDGTTSTIFADMGVTLNPSGANTLLLWGTGTGDVYGRAG